MKCCVNCFDDVIIKNYIEQDGNKGCCSYCKSSDINCLDTQVLIPFFEVFSELYDPNYTSIFEGEYSLANTLNDDWGIFSSLLDDDMREELLSSILKDSEVSVFRKNLLKGWKRYKQTFTPRIEELWDNFAHSIKNERRFIIEPIDPTYDQTGVMNNFTVELIKDQVDFFKNSLNQGTVLYRARLGGKKEGAPYPIEEMTEPPVNKSRSGRANPLGIVYLYLATDEGTALAEVRPWKGAVVSTANFIVNYNIPILDLTDIPSIRSPFDFREGGAKQLVDELQKRELFKKLGYELAKPLNPFESDIEYIPTQYLAELVKYLNCRGIKYKSAMGTGDNYVLFYPEDATPKSVKLLKVDDISYKYKNVNM